MKTEIEDCLARIRSDAGQIAGTGFIVGNLHVITGAHVVNQALRLPFGEQRRPEQPLRLDFPFYRNATATARVVVWTPIREDGSGDIAILRLDAPFDARPLTLLADPEPDELWEHEFITCGFPAGNDAGVWAHGQVFDRRADGSVQIEGQTATGFRIQSGFSGAPVLDKKLNSLVGMVVSAERQSETKAAFMIPTKLLVEDCEELKRWVTPSYPAAVAKYMDKACELHRNVEEKTGNYIRLSALRDSDQEIPDALKHIKAILTTQTDSSVLVLGDYGSGKTKLAFRLTYELAEEALQSGMRTGIPFYLNLSFLKGQSLTAAVCDYLKRYNIQLEESDLLDMMNRRPNIVFILDGLDEMANRRNWGEIPKIKEMVAALRVSPGIRIVLTSRGTFFRDRLEEKVVEVDERIVLLKLSDESISEYLAVNNNISRAAIERLFNNYPSIRELCRSPIHIFMLSKHISALSDIRKDDIKAVDLYDIFIEHTLLDNSDAFPEWPPIERRKFIQTLADRWFKNEIFEILPRQLFEYVRSEFPSGTPERLWELTIYLLNCGIFIRIANHYRFIHYSFVEYFVAELLVDDLYAGRLERWAARTLYAEIFDFMSEFIQRRGAAQIPIEQVVASQHEEAQSNVIATMYREPSPWVKPYFERLLISANHDLVRCLACQGLGLYDKVDAGLIRVAFNQERNSIIKSLLRAIAEHLAETTPDARDSYLQACAGDFEIMPEDAERILNTKASTHSLNGYRRALRVGDKRWTTTVAAMYL